VKKGQAKAAKAIPLPLPKSPQSKGKAEAQKKVGVKNAIISFIVLSTIIIVWQLNRAPATAPATPGGVQSETSTAAVTAPGGGTTTSGVTGPGAGSLTAAGGEGAGLAIATVRITPSQPVATEPITAVVTLAGGDAGEAIFTYQWKRNDQFIPEATTNVLKDTSLRRGDRVSVVATAYRNGVAGPPAESQTVVVSSLPPALEMKILTPQVRLGQPFEIQLSGAAPDGAKVAYSLIAPFLEGMTIDGNTGKIIWTPTRAFTGKLLFGAAATDPDGNKSARVFELDMGLAPGT
jgi:hypothetical protein